MGIDVWVRRRSTIQTEDIAPVNARPETRRTTIGLSPIASLATASPSSTSVVWTAVSAGQVVLLARLDVPHDRRLAQDLVLAAAGYPLETPALVTFVQTRASTGEPSSEVSAFARGQTDRRGAERLIVTVSAARALGLDADAKELRGLRCHVIEEIAGLRASPDAKRDVWRALIQRP
jgi:hypothetical protein